MARKAIKEETPRRLPNALLRRAREERNWSQQEVADQIGTTLVNVSRWERNVTSPQPYYRQKLCDLFGKSAHELGLLELHSGTATDDPPSFEKVQGVNLPLSGRNLDDPVPAHPMADDTELVGRDNLFHYLKQRLCSGETLALHGLPGVGKTALSTALTDDRQVRAAFADGLLRASLEPQSRLSDILHQWGKRLELPDDQMPLLKSEEDWARALRSHIGMRRLLIVIDDAWNIEEAVALKVGGPRCTYLLTTRFPSIAAAFALHGAVLVPELSEEDGIALLGQFAPEFAHGDPAIAHLLVRLVGALPLALTLMGKYLYVQAYSADRHRRLRAAIAQLQDARTRLQLSAPISLADRPVGLSANMPASLWSMIALSDQYLDEQARAALYAFAVFPAKPASFSVAAALAVSGQTTAELDALLDAGLLECVGFERYTLHQSIADYARLHLKEALPWQRLIRYVVACVDTHRHEPVLLLREESTILAGLEAAQRLGQHQDLVRGVIGFVPLLLAQGSYPLARHLLCQANEAATASHNALDGMRILFLLGKVAQRQGDYLQATASFQRALHLARQAQVRSWERTLLAVLGVMESRQGHTALAEQYVREGLRLARRAGDKEQHGTLLLNLGWIAQGRGNYAQAEEAYREATDVLRTVGKDGLLCLALLLQGEVCALEGKCAGAEPCYREGLTLARRSKEGQEAGWEVLLDGAEVLSTFEEEPGPEEQDAGGEQMRTSSQSRLALAHPVGYHELLCRLLMGLAGMAVNRGDDGQAEAYYKEGLEVAQRLGNRDRCTIFLLNLAEIATRQGKLGRAERSYQEGLALARRLGHPGRIALLLLKLAEVKIRQADAAAGEVYLQEGLALAQQAQDQQALRLAQALRVIVQARTGGRE
jgi:tetratricopeptide (TPR) repeat protein/transcriptional regulator with XRE-family HTH domain